MALSRIKVAMVDGAVSKAELAGPAALPVPPLEYSGNKVSTPLPGDGTVLTAQEFVAPVHLNMEHVTDAVLPESGPLFSFGAKGVTTGQFWSQDSYVLRGLTAVGGTPEIAVFQPWTSHTATVEDCRIMQNGAPGKWALNFKQQNWWPIVRGNTFADYSALGGSFCKAIDDGGAPALRYSGNSRMVFAQNRLKWLGENKPGGTGFYGSAVANKLRDNAMEGGLIAVRLGAPSTFTTVDGTYVELPFGGQTAVMLGDPEVAPNNTISLVSVHDLYVNMHGTGTAAVVGNQIIGVGNPSVVVNALYLDRVYAPNQPANPSPIVALNDLGGQKVYAGDIYAEDTPLIPLLAGNYAAVIDRRGAAIPPMNGDLVYTEQNVVAVPAGVSTPVALNWFIKSAAASTFTRSGSGTARRLLRQSRYLGVCEFLAGTNLLAYELPRACLYEGEMLTFQIVLNSSLQLDHTLSIRIYNPSGQRQTLRTKAVRTGPSWTEHTVSFYCDPFADSEASVLVAELGHVASSSVVVYATGARFNRGAFGLCGRTDLLSYAETAAAITGGQGFIAP